MNELIPRHQFSWGTELLDTFPVVVIQGARQVGKSTFASQLMRGRQHVTANFDRADDRENASADPHSFVELAERGTLVIDEVQRASEVLLAIKASVDRDRRPGRFLLTGSSDLLRLSRTPDSLAGRAVTLELHGFSRGELSGTKEDFARRVRNREFTAFEEPSPWKRADYIEMLTRGGFPEAQHLEGRLRNAWFDSYLTRILKRDIGDVSRGLSSGRLDAVLRLISANQGGELVQARLADALAMPKSSIASYLSALQTIYLTHSLPPWRANLTKREIGRHKVSVSDSGLAMRLAALRTSALESLSQSSLVGMHLEAFVTSELVKQSGWSTEEFRLFHFRDRNGLEVDIVIEYDDGSVYLIEVKASATYRSEHARGIRALAERLGDRFIGGAVLGFGTQPVFMGDRIWGLPIGAIWQH